MLSCFYTLLVLQSVNATGQALLDSSFQKLLKLRSVTFELSMPGMEEINLGGMTFATMRGGYYRMKMPSMEMISTPQKQTMLMVEEKKYMTIPGLSGETFGTIPYPGFEAFQGSGAKPPKAIGEPRLLNIAGRQVYRVPLGKAGPMPEGTSLLIDRITVLPAGLALTVGKDQTTILYTKLEADSLQEKDFVWEPPEGWDEATATEMGSSAQASAGEDEYTKKLLKVGAPAPDFNAKRTDGKTLSFSELRKGKKATLVNFWFYG